MMLNIIFELIDLVCNPVGFILDVVLDSVVPVDGSVVYCKIGPIEHTGIYIAGYRQIIHRNRQGDIELVPPAMFTLFEGDTIYVSCRDNLPVGSNRTAMRALDAYHATTWEPYHFISNNCHRLVVGCVTGDTDTPSFSFFMLEVELRLATQHNSWRMWKTEDGNYLK